MKKGLPHSGATQHQGPSTSGVAATSATGGRRCSPTCRRRRGGGRGAAMPGSKALGCHSSRAQFSGCCCLLLLPLPLLRAPPSAWPCDTGGAAGPLAKEDMRAAADALKPLQAAAKSSTSGVGKQVA